MQLGLICTFSSFVDAKAINWQLASTAVIMSIGWESNRLAAESGRLVSFQPLAPMWIVRLMQTRERAVTLERAKLPP